MEQAIPKLNSYEDLLARENFRESLPFHPANDRKFDAVLWPYHFKEMSPCGIARCHKKHNKGYLIRASDGLEVAIGNRCGKREFGADFERDSKRANEAMTKARRIRAIREMQSKIPTMVDVLNKIDQGYKALMELKRRLTGAVDGEIYKKLIRMSELGESKIVTSVRMTRAEAEVVWQTTNRRENDGLGWPHKDVVLATLEGVSFIKARFKDIVDTGLMRPLRELEKKTSAEISDMKGGELIETAKWVGNVPTNITITLDIIAAGWRFFTPDNIAKLEHMGAEPSVLKLFMQDLQSQAA